MSKKSWLIPDNIYDYFQSVSLRDFTVLAELRRRNEDVAHGTMQVSPEQGQFMQLLVRLIGARKCLEVGVFTGYSSLSVALALPADGRIVACDVSVEWTSIAREFWQRAGVTDKIDLRLAPAIETLDGLIAQGHAESFDFVFIDADKANYSIYYERAYQLVRKGGLIAVDNTLWSGRPADPNDHSEDTQAIRDFNKKLLLDQRVSLSMLPIGDGLTLALKQG